MALQIVVEDNRFTVEWQGYFTISLPDTPSNGKSILVFLRSLQDGMGKRMFTFQELSVLFDSNNRQASSQHMEDFRDSWCITVCNWFLVWCAQDHHTETDAGPGVSVVGYCV